MYGDIDKIDLETNKTNMMIVYNPEQHIVIFVK